MNYEDARILFVGGTWDEHQGAPSTLAGLIAEQVKNAHTTEHNGGNFTELEQLITAQKHDLVYWFADIPNTLPKLVGTIKEHAPASILVTSKRARDYTLGELIGRALKNKSNLFLAIDEFGERRYAGRVMDPLGNQYAHSKDFPALGRALRKRSAELLAYSRSGSTYGGEERHASDAPEFFAIIEAYANRFHEIVHGVAQPERFLGNASFRCEHGFPSFRDEGGIYVTRRNVDKRHISTASFIPVAPQLPVRYFSAHKPSVDTPIQVALYDALPKIKYMLHGHVYVRGSPMTEKPIPCGALEEIAAVRALVDPDADFFAINLRGHGMLVGAADPQRLQGLELYARPAPEHHERYQEEHL